MTSLRSATGRRFWHGERGSASLELAVLTPALLLLTFAVVQAALWFHARSLALAAAQAGVTAGRAYTAGPGAGVGRAEAFLAQHAGDALRDTVVGAGGSTAVVVRVEVRGRVLSVLPGVAGIPVRQDAQAQREHLTREATS